MGLVTWRGCGACQFPPYPVSCEAGRRRSRQPAPPATRSQPTVGGVAGAVLGRQGQRPPARREPGTVLWPPDSPAVPTVCLALGPSGRFPRQAPFPLPWASSRGKRGGSAPPPDPFIPRTPAGSWQSGRALMRQESFALWKRAAWWDPLCRLADIGGASTGEGHLITRLSSEMWGLNTNEVSNLHI